MHLILLFSVILAISLGMIQDTINEIDDRLRELEDDDEELD